MNRSTVSVLTLGGIAACGISLYYLLKNVYKKNSITVQKALYFVGIDLGATNAKAGVVDGEGNLLATQSKPLNDYSDTGVVDSLVEVATKAISDAGLTWSDICEIGVGSPGTIDFDVRFLSKNEI